MVLKELLSILAPKQEISVYMDKIIEPDYKGESWDCPWWLADMEIYGEMASVENVLEVTVR